jgi:hypothetical protein
MSRNVHGLEKSIIESRDLHQDVHDEKFYEHDCRIQKGLVYMEGLSILCDKKKREPPPGSQKNALHHK